MQICQIATRLAKIMQIIHRLMPITSKCIIMLWVVCSIKFVTLSQVRHSYHVLPMVGNGIHIILSVIAHASVNLCYDANAIYRTRSNYSNILIA